MGKFIGAFLIFIFIAFIFATLIGVILLYIKGIKKKLENNKFKKDYYNNNTQQMQELIRLQKMQIEELQKQNKNDNQNQ